MESESKNGVQELQDQDAKRTKVKSVYPSWKKILDSDIRPDFTVNSPVSIQSEILLFKTKKGIVFPGRVVQYTANYHSFKKDDVIIEHLDGTGFYLKLSALLGWEYLPK